MHFFLVMIPTPTLTEEFAADPAFVRFYLVVNSFLVSIQLSLCEEFVTDVTLCNGWKEVVREFIYHSNLCVNVIYLQLQRIIKVISKTTGYICLSHKFYRYI